MYAYREELDAWMARGACATTRTHGPAELIERSELMIKPEPPPPAARPPGILVLPFENLDLARPTSFGDAICQHLIARLAEFQRSVRVLSWQTSKNSRHWVDPLPLMAANLNVRYLIEGSIDCSEGLKRVDVRVIDAELDHVLLADHFVSSSETATMFQHQVAEAIASHFALIHEGALVEPICVGGTTPATMLDYLNGARQFFEEGSLALGDVHASLARALTRDPEFAPARAMQGLTLLQAAGGDRQREACSDRVRTIASICNASTSARVTAAFLNAAISIACDGDWPRAEKQLAKALRWLPPSIPSRGRLYERRSSLRPRSEVSAAPPSTKELERDGHGDVFANLFALLATINHRHATRNATQLQIAAATHSANSARWGLDLKARPPN